MPNFGINSAVIILGFVKKKQPAAENNIKIRAPIAFIYLSTMVLGIMNLALPQALFMDLKKQYITSVQLGVQFKGQFRWHMNFGARKDMHYSNSIANSPALQDKGVSANNVYFTTGIEY